MTEQIHDTERKVGIQDIDTFKKAINGMTENFSQVIMSDTKPQIRKLREH